MAEGIFGYASGISPKLGPDGKFQINRDEVVIAQHFPDDEVDLDSGFLMVPSSIPEAPGVTPIVKPPEGPTVPPEIVKPPTQPPGGTPERLRVVRIKFKATRDQVFKAFPAVANLADKSHDGKVTIEIEGMSDQGYDPSWLRNAVKEPLDEADVEFEE